MPKSKSLSTAIILFFILCISLALFSRFVQLYFFQDDFFEINISKASNVSSYLNFFQFRQDIIAYRPISLQNYFFFSQTIFGLNPIGFRFITLFIFIFSTMIIFLTISKLTKSKKIGTLTSFFWATSSIHFLSIAWIAAAYNIIGTFFWLTTFYFLLNFLQNNKKRFYFLSLLLFLFTIGSFEFSVTFTPITFVYLKLVKNFSLRKTIILTSPYFATTLIYLLLRLFLIKVPEIPEYSLSFNQNSIKALFWYFLWAFNVPEEFKKQIIGKLLIFNPTFLREYLSLVVKIFFGVFLLWVTTLIYPFYLAVKEKININKNLIILLCCWFTFGIAPVLLLPNHNFMMYLTLSSIGLYSLISLTLVKLNNNYLIAFSCTVWLFLSETTLSFYHDNYYILTSQKTAMDFKNFMYSTTPKLPDNSVVYFPLADQRLKQALQGSEALRAIYNNQSVSIYYNKKDLINDFKDGKIRGYVFAPLSK